MQQQLLQLPQVQCDPIYMPWSSVQAASMQHHGSTAGSSMALVRHFYSCQLCCLDAALLQLAHKHSQTELHASTIGLSQ